MLKLNIQYFGGRGGSGSGGRNGGTPSIKNTTGASERAIEALKEGIESVKTYGVGKVVIKSSESTSTTGAKSSGRVADPKFEKELSALATENGYIVTYQTISSSSSSARQKQKYGYYQTKTNSKVREANFYKKP